MNDRQIECFLEVSKCMSFSRAAQVLFMTQPTVTHQIATLEEELGFPLFVRSYRSISLTSAGERFYEDMHLIYEQIKHAVSESEKIAHHEDNYLSVGHYSPEGDRLFYQAIYAFSNQYRHFHVDIRLPFVNELVDQLMARKLDAIVVPTQMLPSLESVQTLRLFSNPEFCVMSSRHRLAAHQSLVLDALEDTVCLLGYEESAKIRCWHESQVLAHRNRFSIRNGRTTREMVANLRAEQQCVLFSLYPMHFIDDDLVRVPFSDGPQVVTMLAWRSDNAKTSLRALVNHLQNYYTQNH